MLLAEDEAVLGRGEIIQKSVQKSRLDAAEREELLDIFLASREWTRIHSSWRPNLPDEGDTPMLAEFDAETRFRLRAEPGAGKAERGLVILGKAGG